MTIPHTITGKYGTARIEHATNADLGSILALFDDAVAWLVARGITGQWGTKPFSANPSLRARLQGWISNKSLFAARLDSSIVAILALSETIPPYALSALPEFPDPAFYLEAFTTSRALSGQGLGSDFLRWAEIYSAEQGKHSIWLDCWADNPELVAYYTHQGYTQVRDFYVGNWRGMLFHKSLTNNEQSTSTSTN